MKRALVGNTCTGHIYVQQKTFDEVCKMLSHNLLLSSSDITLPTYIFTDAHKTGLGAILCQGERL